MDRKERFEDPQVALLAALQGWQSELHTAMPGIIQSFDPAKKTCTIQPSIQYKMINPDGTKTWLTLPLLLDCPVVFPSGGGYTLTFPVAQGDECLVIFAERCIDAWWQSGGINQQAVFRMHDLSDGFAFVGASSVPHVQPNISVNSAQLRSNDGATFVELKSGTVNITAPTDVNVTAGGTATLKATHVVIHASQSLAQDVGGYGQKTSNDGSGNITIDTYYTGATVTTVAHAYAPPEIPV